MLEDFNVKPLDRLMLLDKHNISKSVIGFKNSMLYVIDFKDFILNELVSNAKVSKL